MTLLAFLEYANLELVMQYMEESEFTELLQTLIDNSMSSSWFIRHGSIFDLLIHVHALPFPALPLPFLHLSYGPP